MNLNLSALNPRIRLIITGSAGLVALVLILLLVRACTRSEPTADELRLQHMEYLTKVIEAYKARHGSYPQPTARMETPDGILHVWGYEAEKPSLASCTVKLGDDGVVDSMQSRCGGGVYDIDGNLIGWKGVLSLESGENNIEVAERGSGRISFPLSELIKVLPIDPAYAANPTLSKAGFGEYIYAIRNPDAVGADKRQEYQIAATFRSKETNEEYTVIRGNYFVRSDERNQMPTSLIGPGILFDDFGNPVENDQEPLHSLLDGQRKGYPNPILGDGAETLRTLTLERRAVRLLQAIEERIFILGKLSGEDSLSASTKLQDARSLTQKLLTNFVSDKTEPEQKTIDLTALESDLATATTLLQQSIDTFVRDRATSIADILSQELDQRDTALEILRTAFESSTSAEELVLEARDEVLTYFDGKGIEEQTRSRIARKLENIKEEIPNLPELFIARNLRPMNPFLTKDLQDDLFALMDREVDTVRTDAEVLKDDSGTGAVLADDETGSVLMPQTTVSTIAGELTIHYQDLSIIVGDVLDSILTSDAPIEEIDASLKNLAQALATENGRIGALFDSIADVEFMLDLQKSYGLEASKNPLSAMKMVATLVTQHGDFSALQFKPELLDRVVLMQSPGIPDTGTEVNLGEATYLGIPYPLP